MTRSKIARSGSRRPALALVVALGLSACDWPVGPGPAERTISTAAEAEAAFSHLKSASEDIEKKVPRDFGGSLALSGVAGSASVTGRKTAESSSYSNSYSSTSSSDLNVTFNGFKSRASGITVSGAVRWYEFHYSRSAFSSSSSGSSSTDSEALKGSALRVRFVYNGATYADVVTVDADSPSYTSRWDVELTTGAGRSFSFSTR